MASHDKFRTQIEEALKLAEQAVKAHKEAEGATARAFEQVTGGEAFGSLLARTAENAAAMMGLWSNACDSVLRNFRVAGRQDVARIGSRIAQSDDKLERVLQELYTVQAKLAAAEAAAPKLAAEPRVNGAPRNGARRTARGAAAKAKEAR